MSFYIVFLCYQYTHSKTYQQTHELKCIIYYLRNISSFGWDDCSHGRYDRDIELAVWFAMFKPEETACKARVFHAIKHA